MDKEQLIMEVIVVVHRLLEVGMAVALAVRGLAPRIVVLEVVALHI